MKLSRSLATILFNAGLVIPFILPHTGETALAWGALIGAGIGLVGNAISSKGAQKAAQSTNDTNLEATRLANEADYRKFLESRGSTGSAVLPLYFGGAEKDIAKNLLSSFGDGEFSTRFADTAKDLYPSIVQGNDLINRIQSGEIYNERKGFVDAKKSARKAAINDSLNETLKNIQNNRFRAGLGGSSSFTDSLLQGATLNARTQNALAGILDSENLYADDLNFRLNTLGLPLQRTEQLTQLDSLLNNSRYAGIDALLQRLGFFNLGQGTPPSDRVYFSEAVPNSQQFVGSALSQAGNALGDYYQTKSILDQLNKLSTASTPTTPTLTQAERLQGNNTYSVPLNF